MSWLDQHVTNRDLITYFVGYLVAGYILDALAILGLFPS